MRIREMAIRCRNALLYKVFVHLPYNKVRILGLKKLGFVVGNNVYFLAIRLLHRILFKKGVD